MVQTRQDFTKQMVDVLNTGAANLTDADMNAEAASYHALSTRQSLAISALSLANTANQGVFQLLRSAEWSSAAVPSRWIPRGCVTRRC